MKKEMYVTHRRFTRMAFWLPMEHRRKQVSWRKPRTSGAPIGNRKGGKNDEKQKWKTT